MNQTNYHKQLNQLRFLSEDKILKSMEIKDFNNACWYMETPSLWSTDWKESGKAVYPYPYLIDNSKKTAPPIGVRSSVPLGGIGAGTLELRGDGSFKDLNIFNNHPAHGMKVQSKEALFTLREKTGDNDCFRYLTTHSKDVTENINQITYEGAFPMSRLTFTDNAFSTDVRLYAYSSFSLYDASACAVPAAIFSFELTNPLSKSIDIELTMTMPNHDSKSVQSFTDGIECETLMLTSHDGDATTAFTFNSITELKGSPSSLTEKNIGIRTNAALKPKESRIITFLLTWYNPDRYFNDELIGNYYTTLYSSIKEVEQKTFQSLEIILSEILKWQSLCFDNTLPVWLKDVMINSLAPIYVTSLWTKDGRFRQYESFACPDLDAVHIHFYRSLPFALFFPELLKNTLEAFCTLMSKEGWISHEYGRAGSKNLDCPDYRRDNNPLFLLDMYQYYLSTGDLAFLQAHHSCIKAAVLWEIAACKNLNLPVKLASTYDLDGFETRDNTAYNSFNYLAGLKAGIKLFELLSDSEMTDLCREHFKISSELLRKRMFNGSYYGAWWDQEKGCNSALHADSLYGQLWAFLLDLGTLTDPKELLSHLNAEEFYNNTPNGLTLLTNVDSSYKKGVNYDTTWEAGSLDWTSLMLFLGTPVEKSLSIAKEAAEKWRTTLKDQWDVRDLYKTETGLPWCNSHYSRQLILWAIPLALSGQHYDASTHTLTFHPCKDAPDILPFFIPGAYGTLRKENGCYHIVVKEQVSPLNIRID